MESQTGIVKLSRRQLYNEIWLLSVAGVARKYSLNYSRLMGSCKEARIPYPSSGYWARKNIGKDVSSEIVPLKGDEDLLVELATNNSVIKKIQKVKPEADHIEKKPIEEELLEEKPAEEIPVVSVEEEPVVPAEPEALAVPAPSFWRRVAVIACILLAAFALFLGDRPADIRP